MKKGARFGTDMLGSATACGRIPLSQAYGLRDGEGVSVREELSRIGFLGEAPADIAAPYAFVELHIEQGPVLAREDIDVGVVTGVQAISWFEITIHGRSAHAGTTPMELRADAGLMASMLNVHLNEIARSGLYGEHMRATVGRIVPLPNLVNIVPGAVTCTVDLRNPDDMMMKSAEEELRRFLASLDAEVSLKQTARTDSVAFDDTIMSLIETHVDALGATRHRLVSGAGHDAQELAAICPTGMIFVPGLHDGISHNPREASTVEACARGAQILANVLVELAQR